ncbi:MAG: ATPase, partial [Clostridiales bacterium]
KGGTGKTTVAAGFIDLLEVRAFADCDVDAPNLHLVVGISGQAQQTDYYGVQKAEINPAQCNGCGVCLAHCRFAAIAVIDGRCQVNAYACEGCGICLHLCPQNAVMMRDDIAGTQLLYCAERVFSTAKLKMGCGNSGKLVTAVKMGLNQAALDGELAVIDGSPGIGCPVIASISGVTLVLIVAEPSLSGISDMERVVKTAGIFETKTAVCVNKYDTCLEQTQAIEAFCAGHNLPFVGRIPYDRQASCAINDGRSLARVNCPAGVALREVCKNTMNLLEAEETIL